MWINGLEVGHPFRHTHRQRTQATHTANTHRQYTQPIHTGNTHSQYTQPIHTANTHRQYTQAIHTGNTHRQYTQPIHTGNTHSQYTQAIHTATAQVVDTGDTQGVTVVVYKHYIIGTSHMYCDRTKSWQYTDYIDL